MTTSHKRLLSVGEVRVHGEECVDARDSGHLDRDRAASVVDGSGASAARFESRNPVPAKPEAEDDRLRLLAALIVLRCS
jgi:hypothetical protein